MAAFGFSLAPPVAEVEELTFAPMAAFGFSLAPPVAEAEEPAFAPMAAFGFSLAPPVAEVEEPAFAPVAVVGFTLALVVALDLAPTGALVWSDVSDFVSGREGLALAAAIFAPADVLPWAWVAAWICWGVA